MADLAENRTNRASRPSQILSSLNGALCLFYTLYAVRYPLYEMTHAHKPLFGKQARFLNILVY